MTTETITRTLTIEYDEESRPVREITVSTFETESREGGPRGILEPREGDRVRLTYGDGNTVEGTWRAVLERDDGTLHTHTRGQVRRDIIERHPVKTHPSMDVFEVARWLLAESQPHVGWHTAGPELQQHFIDRAVAMFAACPSLAVRG